YSTRCLVSLSRRNRMWTAGEVFRLYFLPRRSRRGLLPSHRQVIPLLMISAPGYFHLHLISDSTGETLITVARAAAAQYSRIMPVEHVHPLVRTQKQLDRVLNEIEEMPGIVLYTLLQE